MKAFSYNILSAMFLSVCLLSGCSDESKVFQNGENSGDTVDRISVALTSHSVKTDAGNGDSESDKFIVDDIDIAELIPYDISFKENSILQISQQTQIREPFRNDDDIFNYIYMGTPEASMATWGDTLSYNFEAYRPVTPLRWEYIGKGESYNGGFAMYALYFPLENKLRRNVLDNGSIRYNVMQDQSTLENLMKSDILGGYHSTPKLHSRIAFKMYHLMSYFRIRLYVPLYNDDNKTGYREDALLYATINNVTNEFAIDWNTTLSSDETGPAVSAVEGSNEIIMYQHPLPPGETKHKIDSIPYKDFIYDGYFNQKIEGDYDYVRIYDFSVIIPYQKGEIRSDGKEHNFTETNFLSFYFQTNAGAVTKYYFNPTLNNGTTSSQFEMKQGLLQYLQLYVPRVGNEIVNMGASVKDWTQMGGNTSLEEVEDDE